MSETMWQGIEGHDDVVNAFRQAIERGRLGHAYMLIGPHGIGKRRFALALAQTLLCENRPCDRFEACGTCSSCVHVRAETHPDLIQIGRRADEHELPIETIRQTIHDLGFKPDRGRYKIAVIDDADDMNQESANCFLKCLEEPPPRSLLLLIGTSPELQLATIRSRCQMVRFQALPASAIARALLSSGVATDAAHAERLAALSGGSLERARGFADPALCTFREQLARELAAQQVNSVRIAESMNELIEAAGKESPAKRTRAKLLLGMAAELLHASMRQSCGARARAGEQAGQAFVDQIASSRSPEHIANGIERCLAADYRIDRMGNVPLVVEAWADEMARDWCSHAF
jgi:DNA polymerase-3 subunit delta'